MSDHSRNQVTDVRSGDDGGGGKEAHPFPVAAIQRERNADRLAVVTADLEAVAAPASIALLYRDSAFMAPVWRSRQRICITQSTRL
jgi:hypothetical protein